MRKNRVAWILFSLALSKASFAVSPEVSPSRSIVVQHSQSQLAKLKTEPGWIRRTCAALLSLFKGQKKSEATIQDQMMSPEWLPMTPELEQVLLKRTYSLAHALDLQTDLKGMWFSEVEEGTIVTIRTTESKTLLHAVLLDREQGKFLVLIKEADQLKEKEVFLDKTKIEQISTGMHLSKESMDKHHFILKTRKFLQDIVALYNKGEKEKEIFVESDQTEETPWVKLTITNAKLSDGFVKSTLTFPDANMVTLLTCLNEFKVYNADIKISPSLGGDGYFIHLVLRQSYHGLGSEIENEFQKQGLIFTTSKHQQNDSGFHLPMSI